MDTNEKLKAVQMIYAGALADMTLRMGNAGVLEQITKEKRDEQFITGKSRALQMGITKPEEVFTRLSDLMGCANWQIERTDENEFRAVATGCALCTIAKKIGAPSPCNPFCLNPMEGMVVGFAPETEFSVEDTLYEGNECRVCVRSTAVEK
jgi:L-2-amino-thiazoline-4-carboxylic acid hydrolase